MPSIALRGLPLILATLLAVLGATVVVVLSARADASRRAQLSLLRVHDAFNSLGAAPLKSGGPGASGPGSRSFDQHFNNTVEAALSSLRPEVARLRTLPRVSGISLLERSIREDIASQEASVANLRAHPNAIAESLNGHSSAATLAIFRRMSAASAATEAAFARVNRAYSSRAALARTQEIVGVGIVIALLLLAFVFYLRRSRQLHDQVEALLVKSRHEAITDPLTGLSNRRALNRDLETGVSTLTDGEYLLIALYDLDGFKSYNDTFGHSAGDALLARLSANLRAEMDGIGRVYRMGGDEFCLLARREISSDGQVARRGVSSLAESGEGFSITASYGACRVPEEASDVTDALRLADARLYQQKGERRPSTVGEVTAALLTAMAEHGADLGCRTTEVSELARLTAEELGLSSDEVGRISVAAKLYDIGKLAIPDSVLTKPGPLQDEERSFVRRHPLIGARIVTAAPSLAAVAPIVRSSHEHFDGRGYPDGLREEHIPIGARVIAVCDAYFHATRSGTDAAGAGFGDPALAEVQSRSGTAFDPEVVRAFSAVLAERTRLTKA